MIVLRMFHGEFTGEFTGEVEGAVGARMLRVVPGLNDGP